MLNIENYGFNKYTRDILDDLLRSLNKAYSDYEDLLYRNTEKKDGRVVFHFVKNKQAGDKFTVDFNDEKVYLRRYNKYRSVEAEYDLEGKCLKYYFAYRSAGEKALVTGFLGGLQYEYQLAVTMHQSVDKSFDKVALKYSTVLRYFHVVCERDLRFEEDLETYLKKADSNYDRQENESFISFLERKVKVDKSEVLKHQ